MIFILFSGYLKTCNFKFNYIKGILFTDFSSQHHSKENTNIQANLLVGHLNWITVAYSHFVCCYKLKEGMGWQLVNIF